MALQLPSDLTMILFAALPMLVGEIDRDSLYRVVEASHSVHFAGKLGNRIEDRLVVTRDGETYEVVIGRHHTHIHGKTPIFIEGDQVRIHGVRTGNRIFVLPDEIELMKQ